MNHRYSSQPFGVGVSGRLRRAIQAFWASVGRFPIASQLGLLVIAGGILADLVAHLDPALPHDHTPASGPQVAAHLVVFLGMVLVLGGVVADGVRLNQSPRRVPIQEK